MAHHRDLDRYVDEFERVRADASLFVTEDDHAAAARGGQVGQADGLVGEFDSDDGSRGNASSGPSTEVGTSTS